MNSTHSVQRPSFLYSDNILNLLSVSCKVWSILSNATMDFLDPKKKRAQIKRLYIGYGLMAIALLAATYLLVSAGYGFDIDRSTGKLIQNGLIVVDSHPTSANISVNGKDQGKTGSRLVLPAGQYSLELSASGYRSWKHGVNLEGSSIEQLVYPLLFPTQLTTKPVQDYGGLPNMVSASPDRHWLIVKTPEANGTFQVIDISNTKHVTTAINLPADSFATTPGAGAFEAVEWASDNVHLLLKHAVASGNEYILLNRQNPAASINLNKYFGAQPFTTASLRDKKSDQIYLHNAADGNLFSADTKTNAIVKIISNVVNYKSYQANIVLYIVIPSATSTTAEVHLHKDSQDYLIRTMPVATAYLLDMAQFDGHFYLAIGSPTDARAYVYRDPFGDLGAVPARTPQPVRVLIVPGAQFVSFSGNARFIAVQGGSNFAVYDAETDRQHRYDTKLPLVAGQKAVWMDGHRLTLISDGKVNVYDFDGTNLQVLSDALPAYAPMFNTDYSAMFTMAPTAAAPDKASLARTELVVSK